MNTLAIVLTIVLALIGYVISRKNKAFENRQKGNFNIKKLPIETGLPSALANMLLFLTTTLAVGNLLGGVTMNVLLLVFVVLLSLNIVTIFATISKSTK